MEIYFSKYFPELLLQRPLFYAWPVGIRFEIGPGAVPIWKDEERIIPNEAYFSEALRRSCYIFNQLFSPDDDIILVYQYYAKTVEKANILLHVKDHESKKVTQTDVNNIYNDDPEVTGDSNWKRIQVRLKSSELNEVGIFKGLINLDFPERRGSFSGECFFVNISRHIILNLYDDRGMDVVAAKKESLNQLYSVCNRWILEYDREKIDEVFKQ